MPDKLVRVALPPGLYRNGTNYQAAGRWFDASLIRFLAGTIQPIGGWRWLEGSDGSPLLQLAGVPRAALAWRRDNGDPVIAVGTTEKLYVIAGGERSDITPVGFTPGAVDTGYVAANGAYGYGPYGSGAYGTGSQTAALAEADTWQLDVFGEHLVAVSTSDQLLYEWAGDPAVLPTVPAGAPATVNAVVVTPEGYLFALGADSNARLVRWASQGTTTEWTPGPTTTAGEFELPTNGRIRAGRRTRGQTLLWTDSDLHVATWIGGEFVYRFDRVANGAGLIAPNAIAMVGDQAFWMSQGKFMGYDGAAGEIPSDVRDYVFGDFNEVQAAKVWAMPLSRFGEVWWFYPSASATEIDRYVVYNYVEKHWTVGRLTRTAGFDAGEMPYPILISALGEVYEHEVLHDRTQPFVADGTVTSGGTEVADGVLEQYTQTPYLLSGPLELGDGDTRVSITQIVPDAKTLSDVSLTILGASDPTSDETSHGPFTLAQPMHVRINARQVRLLYTEVAAADWRIGVPRFAVRASSRR